MFLGGGISNIELRNVECRSGEGEFRIQNAEVRREGRLGGELQVPLVNLAGIVCVHKKGEAGH